MRSGCVRAAISATHRRRRSCWMCAGAGFRVVGRLDMADTSPAVRFGSRQFDVPQAPSDEYGLPAAQLPVERDPPYVSREIQAKFPLEIGRGGLQLLPVDLGATFLECKHDEIAVRSDLQRHDFISKHRAYLSDVRGTAVQIATHIGDEHASTGETAVGVVIELDRVELRGDALAIAGVSQDHV